METISGLVKRHINNYAPSAQREAEAQLHYLLQHKYNYSRLDYLKGADLNYEKKAAFKSDLQLLLENYPVQHIVGFTYFKSLKIRVNRDVLIPRQETEELVDLIFERTDLRFNKALDLATGSGCIAIALAQKFKKVFALEKSIKALKVAKENADLNKAEVTFIEDDLLNPIQTWPKDLDLIVSNPPYVRKKEIQGMSSNVLEHEPHEALFVEDDNPLIFYERIAQYALQLLNLNGILAFEMNQFLAKETEALLLEKFEQVVILKDHFNNQRFAFCSRPKYT